MAVQIHLPLSPIDKILQPPLYYLQVQDTLILSSGILWTTTYILYVRQAYHDESYGMPILSLYDDIYDFFTFSKSTKQYIS